MKSLKQKQLSNLREKYQYYQSIDTDTLTLMLIDAKIERKNKKPFNTTVLFLFISLIVLIPMITLVIYGFLYEKSVMLETNMFFKLWILTIFLIASFYVLCKMIVSFADDSDDLNEKIEIISSILLERIK